MPHTSQMIARRALSTILALAIMVAADGTGTRAQAEGRLVPLFEMSRTSNANGGTIAPEVILGGVAAPTPAALRPRPDTVIGSGLIWQDAWQGDIAGARLSVSPFLRIERQMDSGRQSRAYGLTAMVQRPLAGQREMSMGLVLARQRILGAPDTSDLATLRLRYRMQRAGGARLDLAVVGEMLSTAAGRRRAIGAEARHDMRLGPMGLRTEAWLRGRSSRVPGLGGQDAGARIALSRELPAGRIELRFGIEHARDGAARAGQPAPRRETTRSLRIAHALPVSGPMAPPLAVRAMLMGEARLEFHALHARTSSNLALHRRRETAAGIALRVDF
jgi:hypothetical protein